MKLAILFLTLTIADLVSTVVGINLGLAEAGPTAPIVYGTSTAVYAMFRVGGALLVVAAWRGYIYLFRHIDGAMFVAQGGQLLVSLLLAVVVVKNTILIWRVAY